MNGEAAKKSSFQDVQRDQSNRDFANGTNFIGNKNYSGMQKYFEYYPHYDSPSTFASSDIALLSSIGNDSTDTTEFILKNLLEALGKL
jgi:hypothetical protein